MDHNNFTILADSTIKPECDSGELTFSEEEQRGCSISFTLTEDLTTNGSCSISCSLQRAETLLRSTFNPGLKWLFHGCSPDYEEQEGTHNLASWSSACLQRLQQALPTVAPQWQQVNRVHMRSPQVYVREGGVLLLPLSALVQERFSDLWRLLEQRSLLLFIHEFTRRTRLAAAYISRVSQLMEDHCLKSAYQTSSSWSSFTVDLSSLCQELRVHVSHWSCLSSRVQCDLHLRSAVVQHSRLLVHVRQTLNVLGLQALVLMEHYVHVILAALVQNDLGVVPRDVVDGILAGTDHYNQAVEEQRAQSSSNQLRMSVLQQAGFHHPAAISVKDLMKIIAVHHADVVAKQLYRWSCRPSSSHAISCDTLELLQDHLSSPSLSSKTPPPLRRSSAHQQNPSGHGRDLHLDCAVLTSSIQQGSESSIKDETSHTYAVQTHLEEFQSHETTVTRLGKCLLMETWSSGVVSDFPLSALCQHDQSRLQLLFQVLVPSSDLLAPLLSHTTEPLTQQLPQIERMPLPHLMDGTASLNLHPDLPQQDTAELDLNSTPAVHPHSGLWRDVDLQKEKPPGAEGASDRSCSVQLLDPGQSVVFEDVFVQYRSLLWAHCSRALRLQLHVLHTGHKRHVNLHDNQRVSHILHALKQDLVPNECRVMLKDFSLYVSVRTAHTHWDYVVCSGLGSTVKDTCVTDVYQSSKHMMTSSNQDSGVMMSATMKQLLRLCTPLLSSLQYLQSGRVGVSSSWLALHIQTVSLMLATMQLSAVWVMSKAYHFLSAWTLNRFLLITQGDLKVLTESFDVIVEQTKCSIMNTDSDPHSILHQLVLRQQIRVLDKATSQLQTFSTLVLRSFSSDCKRMSGEIFAQTMPCASHWRLTHRTGFPRSPSEYASLAAQTVIGQVLDCVAPLSDDARVQALSITIAAFMEAWMEHILKQRIKFSIQGALQLKQDFDSIKEMIQSDTYGLSEELHHRLLSLRVFQQVDSAVLCLLQQPHVKPYLRSGAWEPFTRCCPANVSRDDGAVDSSISNLRSMEGEDMNQWNPPVVTADTPPVDPLTSAEHYLAPSVALGCSQQDWLDLRIHATSRRWRLPGLRCLFKSEP